MTAPPGETTNRFASTLAGGRQTPGSHREPSISGFQQWLALVGRLLRKWFREELVLYLIMPAIFTVGLYYPLRFVMQLRGIDYAQFVVPMITLQTMSFTMISASLHSAMDAKTGLSTRLQSMPILSIVPLAARITTCFFRSVTALVTGLFFGHLIGFRFYAGIGQTALYFGFALAIAFVFSVGADALGTLNRSPESASQAMTIPALFFGFLSCGLVPEMAFPSWIRPFVRDQPISQFVFALRDMSTEGVTASVLLPALAWTAGLAIVLTPLAVWASVRRQ